MADDEKFKNLWRALEDGVKGGHYLLATLLLDKAVSETRPDGDPWGVVLREANKLDMKVPFKSEESFREAFDAANEAGETDWEGAFSQEEDDGFISVMTGALMGLYKKRIGGDEKSVLIAEAEKFYPWLTTLLSENPGTEFTLAAQNEVYADALRSYLAGFENARVVSADVYGDGFDVGEHDLIFAIPTFRDSRYMPGEVEERILPAMPERISRRRDGAVCATGNLVSALAKGGRLVVTLQGRAICLSDEGFEDIKKKIEECRKIYEIAELPGKTFKYTAMKTYLLDVENTVPDPGDSVTVRRYTLVRPESPAVNRFGRSVSYRDPNKFRIRWSVDVADELELAAGESVTFDALEIWRQEDWNVARLLTQRDKAYTDFQNSPINKTTLGEVATAFRGMAIYKTVSEGEVAVLSISNLGENGLVYDDGLDYIPKDDDRMNDVRRLDRYMLKEGDLVLPARGTTMKTAIFHEKDVQCPCVASVNLIAIRPKDFTDENGNVFQKLNTTYLKIFLDSKLGKELLDGLQQGDRLMNMSHRNLDKLLIPLPSKEEQDEKVQEYEKEYRAYREAVDEATGNWNKAKERLQKF